MTLKNLLETVLFNQKITLVKLWNLEGMEDQVICDRMVHASIPYFTLAEFLDSDVVTVEAQVDGKGEPFLYVEV